MNRKKMGRRQKQKKNTIVAYVCCVNLTRQPSPPLHPDDSGRATLILRFSLPPSLPPVPLSRRGMCSVYAREEVERKGSEKGGKDRRSCVRVSLACACDKTDVMGPRDDTIRWGEPIHNLSKDRLKAVSDGVLPLPPRAQR